MGDDSTEHYFNNICTQPQSQKYAINRSRGTEEIETESEKSSNQCTKLILNSTNRHISISVYCATVNFNSGANKHLAVSGKTESSPERSKTSNSIVSSHTKVKKRNQIQKSILEMQLFFNLFRQNTFSSQRRFDRSCMLRCFTD